MIFIRLSTKARKKVKITRLEMMKIIFIPPPISFMILSYGINILSIVCKHRINKVSCPILINRLRIKLTLLLT